MPNDGADPRYQTSNLLGKAPYVEWLSIPNNPYGTKVGLQMLIMHLNYCQLFGQFIIKKKQE